MHEGINTKGSKFGHKRRTATDKRWQGDVTDGEYGASRIVYVFAWSYEDMKGLEPKFYQHQIHLTKDAKPVAQRCYRMNQNYATKVKEEIDKLLRVRIIWPVKQTMWLSPIIVVSKKNGKIRICVDYRKLNVATVTDVFSRYPLQTEC